MFLGLWQGWGGVEGASESESEVRLCLYAIVNTSNGSVAKRARVCVLAYLVAALKIMLLALHPLHAPIAYPAHRLTPPPSAHARR